MFPNVGWSSWRRQDEESEIHHLSGVVPRQARGQLPKRILTDRSGLQRADRECQIGQRCPFPLLFEMVPLLPHIPLVGSSTPQAIGERRLLYTSDLFIGTYLFFFLFLLYLLHWCLRIFTFCFSKDAEDHMSSNAGTGLGGDFLFPVTTTTTTRSRNRTMMQGTVEKSLVCLAEQPSRLLSTVWHVPMCVHKKGNTGERKIQTLISTAASDATEHLEVSDPFLLFYQQFGFALHFPFNCRRPSIPILVCATMIILVPRRQSVPNHDSGLSHAHKIVCSMTGR